MKGLKSSRAASFAVILAVYLLAFLVGLAVYLALPLRWWLSLLISDLAATVFTFLCSLLFENASVYDPYWSVAPPVILVCFAAGRRPTALGVLLLAAVFFWAIRLTANWAYTFGNLTHQDWRYTMLKEKTGGFYPIVNLIGIHVVPTLVVYGCILPAVYLLREGCAANVGSVLALCLSLLAALLQGMADLQMHSYRRRRDGAFCRHGLWKFSRHPNYLGEILMWWGVGLSAALAAPRAWPLLAGALANTVLFLSVSIPMAEKRQSRKEGYAAYRRQTRMLLPLPRLRRGKEVHLKNRKNILRMTLAALFLALAFLLPFLTGQIPEIGAMLCPMHLPVFLAGLLLGPLWGGAVGLTAPLLRSVTLGMPPLFPVAVAMSFELLTYGATAGLFRRLLPKTRPQLYLSLLLSMLAGRAVWGLAMLLCLGVSGGHFTLAAFLAGAFTGALPGIAVQLLLVPPLVLLAEPALRREL